MNRIHKPAHQNRSCDSTLAYQIAYYPWVKLSQAAAARVAWQKSIIMTKEEVLEATYEDRTELFFPKDSSRFHINWEYNNVPTEQQWNELAEDALIRVQFRISSLAGGTGRIAILCLLGAEAKQILNSKREG